MPKGTRKKKKTYQHCTDYGVLGIFSEMMSLKCINNKPRFLMFYNKSRVSSLKKNWINARIWMRNMLILSQKNKLPFNEMEKSSEMFELWNYRNAIFIWNTMCPGHALWSVLQSQEFSKMQTTLTKIKQVVIIIIFLKDAWRSIPILPFKM